jgi:hypothetical protein
MIRRLTVIASLCAVPFATPAHSQVPTRLPAVRIEDSSAFLPPGRWPDSARRVVLDSLNAGRRRWMRRRPPEYLVAVYSTGGMLRSESSSGSYLGWLVRRDSLIRPVIIRPATFDKWKQWFDITIDSSFRMVERAARDPSYQIDRLELDPEYGFPRAWHADDVHNGHGPMFRTDSGYGLSVEVFSVDPRAWQCSWWRRVVRRCPSCVGPLCSDQ